MSPVDRAVPINWLLVIHEHVKKPLTSLSVKRISIQIESFLVQMR